jgi:fructose-1,6-bisphosphatase-3
MKHPEWNMMDRCLMEFIDKERGIITIDGKEYELGDKLWPTLDPENPYALTPEEQDVIDRLRHSFMRSERLQNHVNCLLMRGGMFVIYNSNLMFHAAVPINEDGTMREVVFDGVNLAPRLHAEVQNIHYHVEVTTQAANLCRYHDVVFLQFLQHRAEVTLVWVFTT